MNSSTPTAFQTAHQILKIGKQEIEDLKQAAFHAELKRARICLHLNQEDPIQEMIIAFCKDSHIRPHRHKNKI